MKQPLVSIIMPVFNGENFVKKAIQSVLAQTYTNYELIIIDDGSTDGSYPVIKPFLNKKIQYIYQENIGVAAARNTGISVSAGELIALLDQDDVWLPHKLLLQIEFLNNNPQIGLVHTTIQCINDKDEFVSCKGMIWVGSYSGNCGSQLLAGNGIAPLTILAKANLIKQCGNFNQNRAPADDWDLWLRMSRITSFGFIPEICAYYRIHNANESKNLLKMKRAEIAVLKDYLADFRSSMTTKEKYITERKLMAFYNRAADLAKIQGLYKEANSYLSQSHYIKNHGSIWHFRDEMVKRLSWYSYRLVNLIKN